MNRKLIFVLWLAVSCLSVENVFAAPIAGNDDGVTVQNSGVYGSSSFINRIGVSGYSKNGDGVVGKSGIGNKSGVYGENFINDGTGVSGKATGSNSTGVYGYGEGYGLKGESKGIGVRGKGDSIGVDGDGSTIGVWGKGQMYGMFAQGNIAVLATGSVYSIFAQGKVHIDGDLIVTGNMNGVNLATKTNGCTASASSEYNSYYSADKLIDGIYNRWDEGEAATRGEVNGKYINGEYAWFQLTWSNAQNINKIILYGRPNILDQVNGFRIIGQDASKNTLFNINCGALPVGGVPKVVFLKGSEGIGVKYLQVQIYDCPSKHNAGLAEIEVY
jgi:hypothetical protein